jgi:hypothetical protein
MANTQPLTDPIAVNRDPVNQVGNNGQDMRWGMGALSAPSTGSTFGHLSGVYPGGTGSAGYSNDLQVNATSGMSVTINGGHYAVDRSPYGLYVGAATGSITVTHGTSSPSLPRIDYVVLRVRDSGIDTGVTESAKVIILAGSPGSVPVEPSAQMTNGDLLLASVRIRANTSSVLSTDITDRRVWITARGGITPRRSGDTSVGAYEGQYADDPTNDNLIRWSGSAWEPVASPAVWTTFTPRLMCDGTNTDINIGSGAKLSCRYQLLGKTLRFNYFFKWGTAPFNGGWGNIYTLLPAGLYAATADFSWWNTAHLWINNAVFVADFDGSSWLRGGTNKMYPSFPINPSTGASGFYRIATTSGVAGGSVPHVVNGFAEGGELNMSGAIEVL